MGKKPIGNLKIVMFEVVPDPGIHAYAIAVNDDKLSFHDNRAEAALQKGEAFTLSLSAMGEPGSTITIRYIVDDVRRIAVDRAEIPPDGHIITSYGRFLL